MSDDAETLHQVQLFPRKPMRITRAYGSTLEAEDGRRYTDLGGASHGVANFGHGHPRIVAAIQAQAARAIHVVQTIPTPERAAFLARLHALLPAALSRTFLSNSGTEANEAAIKFAHAKTGRVRIVAARNAFHGRTLGSLAGTFRPNYRKPFERLLGPTDFVPFNDAAALEKAVTDQTSIILLEPVQGEGGLAVATPEFLRAARAAADRHGALLCFDEVQTGLGRTGTNFAFERHNVTPDILTLGKSLAGGLPIGATVMTEATSAAMPAGGHGNTFGGSPLVCAAASAALDVLVHDRLAERSETLGRRFMQRLRDLDAPLLREVRGQGLMVGADLRIKPQPVLDRLIQRGFLALPAGTTVCRFLPPLNIEESLLEEAANALGDILADPALRPEPTPEAVA